MFGTKNALINLNNYFSSSFNCNDYNIPPIDTYNLMLFLDILFYLFLTVGTKIGNLMSTRICILISLLIQYSSFTMIIFFNTNPYITLFSLGVFNIGNAISFLTYMKNCWKYYPLKYGSINGIILSGAGISSSILTFLGEIIINPEKNKNDDCSENVKNIESFLEIVACILLVCGLFGFLFSFQYKEELPPDDKALCRSENGEEDSQEITSDYNISKRTTLFEDKKIKSQLYKSIFSLQNLKLIFIAFIGLRKLIINH